jgi:acyl carrier protein phosphodiesterase
MNHLAHCLLSGENESVLLGNFIGDYVKGSAWKLYPPEVQHGLLLHRHIDSFTDSHPLARRSVHRLRPFAGRYAAPVNDVLYDYLLAIYWDKYISVPFDFFAESTYSRLSARVEFMPPELQERLPRMLSGRFLHAYREKAGLAWILDRFSFRLGKIFDAELVTDHFFGQTDLYAEDFSGFFPEILLSVADFKPLSDIIS